MRKNRMPFTWMFITIILLANFACRESAKSEENQETTKMEKKVRVSSSDFGITDNGENVTKYSLANKNGIEVDIITFGGRIIALRTPDKQGHLQNVVLGFDSLAQYEKKNPFFGALVGRYGNRIANGKFTLGDTEYTLAKNNGENSLHGGLQGFDKKVWKAKTEEADDNVKLILNYLSVDMEEGFPGNLNTTITYTLNADNSLDVLYEAQTDKTTIVNLTQHTYFNLSGEFSKPILDHLVEIDADAFVPVDSGLIPTGELKPVEGTPFDFTEPKQIGKEIDADNEQITLGGGYDHCWVLNDQATGYRSVATAYHPKTGRNLEVLTDQPGIQFYTGNFLDGTLPAPNGGTYAKRSGFCLETQHYPDSPNQPDFPSVTLEPGDTYSTRTTFKFSTN
ncbi:hypothetical protein LCGC14_1037520 [marine sediment metagenome]|uniref:Aldose 1-epimerase n=2 Tax=root TaxID=1 RepID=A0A831VSM1_9FLAO|nr:galactose mutarotase [Pricia antarctica]